MTRHALCQADSGLHCWNIVFSCWALYVLIRSAKVGVDVCYEVESCALLRFYSLFHGSAFYFACVL